MNADIVEHRMQVALKAGADAVVDVSKGTMEDHAAQIKSILGGNLPRVTLDCTGFEASMRLAINVSNSPNDNYCYTIYNVG